MHSQEAIKLQYEPLYCCLQQEEHIIGSSTVLWRGLYCEHDTTQILFASLFPVSGPVVLRGGTLHLRRDLTFQMPGSLMDTGTINGNGHVLMLPRTDFLLFPAKDSWQLNEHILYICDTELVCAGNIGLTVPIRFSGTCVIDCQGGVFDMDEHQCILAPEAQLHFKNGIIRGSVFNAFDMDDTSTLILENVTFILENDLVFEHGALYIEQTCIFSGSSSMTYASDKPCTIKRHSCLRMSDGATLVYDPKMYKNSGIECVDGTSCLSLVYASLHGMKPLLLMRGILHLEGNVCIGGDGTQCQDGIMIGDGKNIRNNMKIVSDASTEVTIMRGYVVYNNV